MMKPILFNADMVRAIMAGKKTVTRRIIKSRPPLNSAVCGLDFGKSELAYVTWKGMPTDICIKPPYTQGDILYVRETWAEWTGGYVYKADDPLSAYPHALVDRWHPSLHMPKEAARLFLRVTDIRVERLQAIMDDPPGPKNQVVREGCKYGCDFIAVWENTVPKKDRPRYGWDANPWVWVIEFERCEKPAVAEGRTV